MRIAIGMAIWLAAAAAQTAGPQFDVASVKPSARHLGKDYRPFQIEVARGRLTAHNASLRELILAAYHVDRYQVPVAPAWIDEDEFDVDAKVEGNAAPDEIRLMLRTLLAQRFALVLRTERKEMRRYGLVVDKGGPKIRPAKDGDARGRFHGDMRQFANLLSIGLSIPTGANDDAAKPMIAMGPGVPVIDKTGLEGVYDIDEHPAPELGTDSFVRWQRVLQDQLGLKLESERGSAEILVVERAEKARENE